MQPLKLNNNSFGKKEWRRNREKEIILEEEDLAWIEKMSEKDNVVPCKSMPYVATMLEDLYEFVKLPEFKEQYLKTILTIGKFGPISSDLSTLSSVTRDSTAKFPVDLSAIRDEILYVKTKDGRREHLIVRGAPIDQFASSRSHLIRRKTLYGTSVGIFEEMGQRVFKVFGIIMDNETGQTVLRIIRLKPVENIDECTQNITAASTMARRKITRYFPPLEEVEPTREIWNKMAEKWRSKRKM